MTTEDSAIEATASEPVTAERVEPLAAPLPRRPLTSQEHSHRLARRGWWIVCGALLPLGTWMAVAPLAMAVAAPAFVTVDLNRRPVQHREGGIVQAVLVRDGQFVKAGETILILGDVGVDADRNRLGYRVSIGLAAIARLEAEQSLAKDLVYADELLAAARADTRVQQALEKETALFKTRRHSITSEIALMRTQRERVKDEIAALREQIRHAERSRDSQSEEVETNRNLVSGGFIGKTRIVQLEAALSDYASRLEERRSELARAQQRLVDIDLRIASIQNEFAQEADDKLKMASSELAEIEQERRKSDDAGARQTVTAPASGLILGLKFNSPGAVVSPGETIAEVVPRDAKLMIEARIRPEDVNNVRVDQHARIQFTAFKYRSSLLVTGTVKYVSADRLVDQPTQMPYYSVLIAADADSLLAAQDLKMQAGMPAQVFIDGGTQTALQYMVEPFTATWRQAARKL
jgi:membrane fusion protein, epimerase transport system